MGAEISRRPVQSIDSDDDQFDGVPWCTRSNTAILLDWDDTLLCTTALRNQDCKPEQLEELERAVEAVLRTAMSLGETIIVTNGIECWVEKSAREYLPGLLPLLSELTIVSARARFEHLYPNDPFAWKRAAFEHLMTKERHYPTDSGLNLVALGDQPPELDAAHHVVRLIGGGSLVKTVKFKEAPSVAELVGQLYRAEQVLRRVAQSEESQSHSFVRRELSKQQQLEHVSRASGWRCELKDKRNARGCSNPSVGLRAVLDFIN